MRKELFTLAELKIVPTIMKLVAGTFFKIVKCDAVKN